MKKLVNSYLAPPLVTLCILLIGWTIKIVEVRGRDLFDKAEKSKEAPTVIVMWHDRLFYLAYFFRFLRRRCKVLASPSTDGEIVARVMSLLGYGVMRGSSYQGARGALRQMKKSVEEGYAIGTVGDGSRGPRHTLQPGPLMVSKLTGAAVAPVVVAFSGYWTLKTWDRFIIPKPFCRAVVIFGEPVESPTDANGEILERLRAKLEADFLALTSLADSYFDNHE